jgi:hypothetical protein
VSNDAFVKVKRVNLRASTAIPARLPSPLLANAEYKYATMVFYYNCNALLFEGVYNKEKLFLYYK